MSAHKAQSAMEYLMTYGWAILIIAVALAILYQLGIFGGSSALLGTSCLAATGYLCGSPQLNTAGNLIVQFGQVGQTVTVTGIACTNSISAPVTIQSVTQTPLASGQKTNIVFNCALSSNTIGTTFKGYLWVQYNTQTQNGNIGEVGSVTAVASTAGTFSSGLSNPTFTATCSSGAPTLMAGNDICTFDSTGTFSVTGTSGSIAILVVAGGGGGGSSEGALSGGGGGGGFIYNGVYPVTAQSYSVTVGGGGAGGGPGSNGVPGVNGANSIFDAITANGGGGGGGQNAACAGNGGSGGGGGELCTTAGAGTAGQGNNGGTGFSGQGGGGGGGAGAVGHVGRDGDGGAGLSSTITGSTVFYAGGGGGSSAFSGGTGAGGIGGGGSAPIGGGPPGNPGTPNTGGGGSGTNSNSGGNGGSGIVIISYNALGNGSP